MSLQLGACSGLPGQGTPEPAEPEATPEPSHAEESEEALDALTEARTPEPTEEPEEIYEDRIWVCLGGYDTLEEKTARFFGRGLTTEYQVIDADTGEVVYTGTLYSAKYLEDAEEYYGEGDFTEVTQSGRYYIVCGEYGKSGTFQIQEEHKEVVLSQLLDSTRTQLLNVEMRTPWQLMMLLLSYEMYAEVYEESESQQTELLDIIGGSIGQLLALTETEESDDRPDLYALAACLAKYGYVCSRYDQALASQAYRQAENIWTQAERELAAEEPISAEYRNLAAAELYRLTSRSKYRTVIEAVTEIGTIGDELACITYLFTTRRVNTRICDNFMSHLMLRADETADAAPLFWDLSREEMTGDALSDSLWGMVILSVMEFAMANYEYGSILVEHYQFLYGKNTDAYCYLDQDIEEDPIWTAESMVLLSEILVHQQDGVVVTSELSAIEDEQDNQ